MRSIEKAIARLGQQPRVAQGKIGQAGAPTAVEPEIESPKKTEQSKSKVELKLRKLARAGYLVPDAMQEPVAEQYRQIKRLILKNTTEWGLSQHEYRNLIAVTSALRAEGKTFTAFNLAVSISMEQDLAVLLVDTDLIARSLTTLAELNDAPGLTDVLIDARVSLGDVIVRTNIPKLSLIPAGRVGQNATELLASERMRRVVRELAGRYSNRVVLFDTAPILVTSQALVLDALVGQVVVVVEEGKTPQQAIQDAVALLEKNKDVGMVLNKSRRKYGGNYGTYYGSS